MIRVQSLNSPRGDADAGAPEPHAAGRRRAGGDGPPPAEAIVEAAPVALVALDGRGRVASWNAAAERLLGHERSRALGRPLAELIRPGGPGGAWRRPPAALAAGRPPEPGLRVRFDAERADGSRVPVEMTTAAVPGTGGEPLLVACLVDLSERRATEADLRRTVERLEAVLDSSEAVAYLKDREGRYLLINRRWAELFGVTKQAVVGLTDAEVFPDEVAAAFRANDLRALEAGRAIETEEVAPHADGPHTYLSIKVPLYDAGGTPYGTCGISTDITARKRVEEALRESEATLRSFFDSTPLLVGVSELVGDEIRVLSVNAATAAMLGRGVEEVRGLTLPELGIGAQEGALWAEKYRQAGREGRPIRFEYCRGEGASRTWQVCAIGPVASSAPERPRFSFVVEDITAHKRAEEALRLGEKRYRTLVEATAAIVWDTPESGGFDSPQPGWSRFTGQSTEELLGSGWLDAVHPDDRAQTYRAWSRAFTTRTPYRIEHRIRRHDGRYRHMSVRAVPIIAEDGSAVEWIGVHTDVTEQRQAEQMLAHQATHDALTGLPNRALLLRRLEEATAPSWSTRGRSALLLLDLDRFKEINDTFGHHHGDEVLRQLNPRFLAAVREGDLVARLGGDEFGILLEGADEAAAVGVADRILADMRAPIVVQGCALDVGASIGVALFPDHGPDAAALLQRADVAMYAAKRGRSGRVVYSPQLADLNPGRLALVGELRRGIEGGELRMHYQPKVRLATGRTAGAEALVRWQHPREGLLPPARFIALAEETGLIRPLGIWTLEAALEECRRWHEAGAGATVAVNLSTENLLDDRLGERIVALVAGARAASGWLTLEVTETSMLAEPARARAVLESLHDLGVRVSIDDFGTGYSSLAYLKELPVDEVKIDRTFVRDMLHSARDSCIVRAIIDLGHTLGLEVVAEGVEDRATAERLADWGCDLAQGYYFGRPRPGPEFLRELQPGPPGPAAPG